VKYDVILAGVGGQGVLSLAAIIARGAMLDGLQVKQSEVHGMAQRGGAVQAHLRLADHAIASDLVALGSADMILGLEPLESLRYLHYLNPRGIVVSASEPLKNIPDYPAPAELYRRLQELPGRRLIDAEELARRAGCARATNMVMVGAASGSLPVRRESLLRAMEEMFAAKGPAVVEANLEAFRLGAEEARG